MPVYNRGMVTVVSKTVGDQFAGELVQNLPLQTRLKVGEGILPEGGPIDLKGILGLCRTEEPPVVQGRSADGRIGRFVDELLRRRSRAPGAEKQNSQRCAVRCRPTGGETGVRLCGCSLQNVSLQNVYRRVREKGYEGDDAASRIS